MRLAVRPALLSAVPLVLLAAGCSNSDGGGTVQEGCLESLAPAANSEFCADEAASPSCALVTGIYEQQVCGVPLQAPPAELARSSNVQEYAGSGPPEVGCFAAGSYPDPPGSSQQVTVSGVAKIFSNGCESNDLRIEIYTVKRTSGPDDGDLDQLIGTPVTTAASCQADGVAIADDKCGTVYECVYTYDGVPTETELAIKTQGAFWAPLYEYNVFIRNDAVVNGVWAHDVRALASDDYGVIAQAAIGGPITATHGALAGEVHDCGDVRLMNAIVDVDVPKKITTYFTSDEDHPLPDVGADGTTALGLYAAIDVPAGPITVAAAGAVGGEVVTLGFLRARIFEDSVTSVTFRGMRPFQVP